MHNKQFECNAIDFLIVSRLSETESSAREIRLRGGEVSEASVSTAGDSVHGSAAPRMDEIMK